MMMEELTGSDRGKEGQEMLWPSCQWWKLFSLLMDDMTVDHDRIGEAGDHNTTPPYFFPNLVKIFVLIHSRFFQF